MPINTDTLDLGQPISGQDISGSTAPLPNPVLDPGRIKSMSEKFRELTGQTKKPQDASKPAQGVATPPKAKEAAVDPDTASRTVVHGTAGKPAATEAEKTADAPVKTANADEPAPTLDASVTLAPRARELFKRLEQSRDSFKTQFEEMTNKNKELLERLKPMEDELTKVKTALPPDLDQLRTQVTQLESITKERDELLSRVETLNLEHSPRFQNWWKENTEKHLKMVQRNVPAEHREKISKLMLEPDSTERNAAIDEIIEPLSNTSKRLINGAIEQIENLKIQREEALSKGSEQFKKLKEVEQQESAKAAAALRARKEQVTKAALERARHLEAFKPIEGDVEHNNAIPAREDLIRAMVAGELDEDVMMGIPGLAMEAIHYREKVVPQLKSQLEEANALIKRLQGASPEPAKGGTQPKTPAPKAGAAGAFLAKFKASQGA